MEDDHASREGRRATPGTFESVAVLASQADEPACFFLTDLLRKGYGVRTRTAYPEALDPSDQTTAVLGVIARASEPDRDRIQQLVATAPGRAVLVAHENDLDPALRERLDVFGTRRPPCYRDYVEAARSVARLAGCDEDLEPAAKVRAMWWFFVAQLPRPLRATIRWAPVLMPVALLATLAGLFFDISGFVRDMRPDATPPRLIFDVDVSDDGAPGYEFTSSQAGLLADRRLLIDIEAPAKTRYPHSLFAVINGAGDVQILTLDQINASLDAPGPPWPYRGDPGVETVLHMAFERMPDIAELESRLEVVTLSGGYGLPMSPRPHQIEWERGRARLVEADAGLKGGFVGAGGNDDWTGAVLEILASTGAQVSGRTFYVFEQGAK